MQISICDIVNLMKNIWFTLSDVLSSWETVTVIAIIILNLFFALFFRKHVNKKSIQQIDFLIKNGKYIPSLYVELNSAAEQLRYFAYPHKWRKKLIRDFNGLFKNIASKRIRETIDENLILRLSKKSNYFRIHEAIENNLKIFEHYRNFPYDEGNRIGQFHFIIEFSSFYYQNRLNELMEYCKVASQNSVILTGSAGNGKTNLLCEFSKMVMNTGNICAFVEARKIKSECTNYFEKQYFTKNLRITQTVSWLWLQNILLYFRRKYLFILIDAINENDNETFITSIREFSNQYAKYKKVKILYSCRSEFFEARYKKYFDSTLIPPYILNSESFSYNLRAKESVLNTYKKYFRFSGTIQGLAKERLFESLLLMRIFFEVYKNDGNLSITQLNNWAIYKKYIEIINKQTEPLRFEEIISRVAALMIAADDYESVRLNKLNLSSTDRALFENALDNNFLITKKIMLREGTLTEESDERIYFVFDELRDYCISRQQLITCENQTPLNYALFYQYVDQLVEKQQSPAEGVLKFSYCHFRAQQKHVECKRLLQDYGQTYFHTPMMRYDKEQPFSSFGAMIILTAIDELLDFEFEYFATISLASIHEWQDLMSYGLRNEYRHNQHGIDLLLQVILHMARLDPNMLKERMLGLFSHRFAIHNQRSFTDQYENYLESINEEDGRLPIGLCKLTIIFYSLVPTASLLYSYIREGILHYPNIVNDLILEYAGTEIVAELELLKKPRQIQEPINSIKQLFKKLEQFNETDDEGIIDE